MTLGIEIIGIIAAILTTAAFIPQVYKTWQTKLVDELSLGMYLVFLTGVVCWLIYGILIHSFAIILANSVTVILVITLILLIFRYKK